MNFVISDQLGQVTQGAGKHPLIGRGALLDQRSRGVRRATMGDQLFADDRQADQTHIKHQGLRRGDQVTPGQIAGAILQMPRHKTHRLRVVAMGQRYPGVGRTTAGCRDPRHHLERNAMGRQLFDLFTTTTKDKRITPLEPDDTLALPGQIHQLPVDLVLRYRMVGAALADINSLGIATAQFKNRRCHQTVVQHHIRLLHQAQGTKGQQVRITRPGTHQVNLTGSDRCFAVDLGQQQTFGFSALPGQLPVSNRALEYVFPEPATLLHIREQAFDLRAKTRRKARQLTVCRRNPGFNLGANQARQNWRVATTGNSNHQRRTINDRRENHAAQGGRIHHIDRHTATMGISGDLRVERFIVGGSNDQDTPFKVCLNIAAQHLFAAAAVYQFAQLGFYLGCDNPQ